MAIDAPTMLSDFSGFYSPEQSAPIFEKAARQSVVQTLVKQHPMSWSGKAVPVVTGRPVAGWVAEGAKKPATKGTRTLKTLQPKKLAAIIVNSAEVVRADPAGYVSSAREDLAEAFGIAFDYASLHNLGGDGTGTGPFSTYLDQTTKAHELGGTSQANGGLQADLKEAMLEVITETDASGTRRYKLTGWALDDIAEPMFWGAVDSTGRPLWTDLPYDASADFLGGTGRLLNRPVFMGEGVSTPNLTSVVGYGGDWSQAAWGVVGGISFDLSDTATVTIDGELVSCWENNLIALRAEAEYGFLLNDPDAFVKLTNNTGS